MSKRKDGAIVILHFLADGQEVKAIKNREVALNDKTRAAYDMLASQENNRG